MMSPPSSMPDGVAAADLAPRRVRRLSAGEMSRSLSDVFLGGKPLPQPLALEPRAEDRFDNAFEVLNLSLGVVETLQATAESVANAAVADLERHLPCAANGTDERTCAALFATTFGRRAYRRPISRAEHGRLMHVYDDVRALGAPFAAGIASVIEAMALSPAFLFRTELGTPAAGEDFVQLNAYEVAAALSYGLWGTTPDDALLDAAAAGLLDTAEGIRATLPRLLGDRRARVGLRNFLWQWLGIGDLEALEKADPTYTPALGQSLLAEAERFFDTFLWEQGDGRFEALFSAGSTLVDAELAAIYDVTPSTAPVMRLLDPTQRAGILTLPAFIASHTKSDGESPIPLGKFVRERFFCQEVPPPLADVPNPSFEPGRSTRDVFAMLTGQPACASCHRLMEPIGFSFEAYGSLGRLSDKTVRGFPANSAGELIGTDVDGPYDGPVGLAKKMLASADVRSCLSTQLLTYLLGRPLISDAQRVPAEARALAAAQDGTPRVQSLLSLFVTSDAFLRRRVVSASEMEAP